MPRRADLGSLSGLVSAGGVATRHGGDGGDVSAMLNLPLVAGRVALRAVGYVSSNPGYIDDIQLNRRDINRTDVRGVRAALRIDPGDDWDVEFDALAQDTSGHDGQYALATLPPLTRTSNYPQPYDNDYRLAAVTVRKQLRGFQLVVATDLVQHHLETQFDATGFPGTAGPQLFVEDLEITMISNETRLSQLNSRGEGWVGGLSFVHDVGEVTRQLGPANALAPLSRLRNELNEAAAFGQYSYPLTSWALVTVGGRLTYNRESGGLTDEPSDVEEPERQSLRLSPSASMTFQIGPRSVAYVRYQQAHRAGGLAVSDSAAGRSVRRFETDSLSSMEAGIRLGQLSRDRTALSASVSQARWQDVQADLIDAGGLPFTTNLGDGRISGFEVEAAWRPIRGLTLELATFVNEFGDSRRGFRWTATGRGRSSQYCRRRWAWRDQIGAANRAWRCTRSFVFLALRGQIAPRGQPAAQSEARRLYRERRRRPPGFRPCWRLAGRDQRRRCEGQSILARQPVFGHPRQPDYTASATHGPIGS